MTTLPESHVEGMPFAFTVTLVSRRCIPLQTVRNNDLPRDHMKDEAMCACDNDKKRDLLIEQVLGQEIRHRSGHRVN